MFGPSSPLGGPFLSQEPFLRRSPPVTPRSGGAFAPAQPVQEAGKLGWGLPSRIPKGMVLEIHSQVGEHKASN